jgi:hypothetical protein
MYLYVFTIDLYVSTIDKDRYALPVSEYKHEHVLFPCIEVDFEIQPDKAGCICMYLHALEH